MKIITREKLFELNVFEFVILFINTCLYVIGAFNVDFRSLWQSLGYLTILVFLCGASIYFCHNKNFLKSTYFTLLLINMVGAAFIFLFCKNFGDENFTRQMKVWAYASFFSWVAIIICYCIASNIVKTIFNNIFGRK